MLFFCCAVDVLLKIGSDIVHGGSIVYFHAVFIIVVVVVFVFRFLHLMCSPSSYPNTDIANCGSPADTPMNTKNDKKRSKKKTHRCDAITSPIGAKFFFVPDKIVLSSPFRYVCCININTL